MAKMEDLLGVFEQYTCVKFKRLTTEDDKALYDYKIKIGWDGVPGTAWSELG